MSHVVLCDLHALMLLFLLGGKSFWVIKLLSKIITDYKPNQATKTVFTCCKYFYIIQISKLKLSLQNFLRVGYIDENSTNHQCVLISCGFVNEMHFRSIKVCLPFWVDFQPWAVVQILSSDFRSHMNIQTIQRGGECKCPFCKMAVWYLLLSHCLCPVIFDLNGFNSVQTSCCQRTETAQPLSFRGHQSFIITRIHQPILVITDYRQPVVAGSRKHTHTYPHTAVWPCVMSGIRNTFTH